MNNIKTLSALAAVLIMTAQAVNAEEPRRGRGQPPQVAVEACSNVTEGDACEFEGRRGEALTGVCATVRSGELACVPEGHRPPGERDDQEPRSEDYS